MLSSTVCGRRGTLVVTLEARPTGEERLVCSSTAAVMFELPHTIEAPPEARELIDRHLCREHASAALAAVQVVAGELSTCAVLYGKPPIRLELDCDVTRLRVAVSHSTHGAPVTEIPIDEDGGLRAALIEKLSRSWGVEPTLSGRTLWSWLPTGAPPEAGEGAMSPGSRSEAV